MKMFLFNNWNDIFLGSVETCFLEVGSYVLWNEPPHASDKVVFAELSENATGFEI